jgi:hypothetical protein
MTRPKKRQDILQGNTFQHKKRGGSKGGSRKKEKMNKKAIDNGKLIDVDS